MASSPQQIAAARAAMASYHKDTTSAGGGVEASDAGPPYWNRGAWESFYSRFGSYPFGPQKEGGFIAPPNYENAPDWVFELMGVRRPPITTGTPRNLD